MFIDWHPHDYPVFLARVRGQRTTDEEPVLVLELESNEGKDMVRMVLTPAQAEKIAVGLLEWMED